MGHALVTIRSSRRRWAFAISIGLTACSSQPTGLVSLESVWAPGSRLATSSSGALTLPASVVTLQASVSGPGMNELVQNFDVSALATGQEATLHIDRVPAGPARVVRLLGRDANDWPAFHGVSAPVDVEVKKTSRARLVLYPSPGAEDDETGVPSIVVRINQGAPATGGRNVSLTLQATGIADMALSNVRPAFTVACADHPWQPYDTGAIPWELADGHGDKTVYAMVRDADGYCNRAPATATILLDQQGPTITAALVDVLDALPGVADTVAGQSGATEPGALVTVYGDAALTQVVGTTTVAAGGSFSAIALGDNFTDDAAGLAAGQPQFWLRAVDAFGNAGPFVTLTVDVSVPDVAIAPASASLYPAGATVRLDVIALDALAAPPVLLFEAVSGAPLGTQTPFDCSTYDEPTATYECVLTLPAGYPEARQLRPVVVGTKSGSGNVARVVGDSVVLDYTAPTAPPADLTLAMNPPGSDDMLGGGAGSVEAGAAVVVWRIDDVITCCPVVNKHLYHELGRTQADAQGAFAPFAVGDNAAATLHVRQIDAAGNDPCPPIFDGTHYNAPACPEKTDVANDVQAELAFFTVTPAASERSTSARFEFDGRDVTSPLRFSCELDGGGATPCTSPRQLSGLVAGDHELTVTLTDGAGNTTSTSHPWTITSVQTVRELPAFSALADRGYFVDGAGDGHFVIGGDHLYHLAEATAFTPEVVDAEIPGPIEYAEARRHGTAIHVVYQPANVTTSSVGALGRSIRYAAFDGSAWSIESVASALSGTELPQIDVVAGSGEPIVLFADCADYQSNGVCDRFVHYLTSRSGGVWSSPAPVGDGWRDARLAVTSSGTAFVFHRAASALTVTSLSPGSGGWQVDGEWPLADVTGNPDDWQSPTLGLDANEAPVVAFDTFNSRTTAAVRRGAAWEYEGLVNTTAPAVWTGGPRGQTAIAPASDGFVWFTGGGAFNQQLGIGWYDPTVNAWGYQNVNLAGHNSEHRALAIRSAGDFASVVLDVGYSSAETPRFLGRYRLQAATDEVRLAGSGGAIEMAFTIHPATGALVLFWYNAATSALTLSTYDGGVWSHDIARVDRAGIRQPGVVVDSAGTVWAASIHHDASSFDRQVRVDRYDGAWTHYTYTFGGSPPQDGLQGYEASLLCLGLSDDLPVLAYSARFAGQAALGLTSWNAAQSQFGVPVQLATFSWPLEGYCAVLGNAGGSDAWIFYHDHYASQYRQIAVASVANPCPSGCPAPVDLVAGSTSRDAWIRAGLDAAARPFVLYREPSTNYVRLRRYDGGWQAPETVCATYTYAPPTFSTANGKLFVASYDLFAQRLVLHRDGASWTSTTTTGKPSQPWAAALIFRNGEVEMIWTDADSADLVAKPTGVN